MHLSLVEHVMDSSYLTSSTCIPLLLQFIHFPPFLLRPLGRSWPSSSSPSGSVSVCRVSAPGRLLFLPPALCPERQTDERWRLMIRLAYRLFFFFCICYPLRPIFLCFFFFFASVRARLFALQIEQLARTVVTDQLKTLWRCGIFGWAASRVADKRGHHRFVGGFTCSVCVCVCVCAGERGGGGTVL